MKFLLIHKTIKIEKYLFLAKEVVL